MTFKELFDKARIRKSAGDSISVDVTCWEHESGRVDFNCYIWSAVQCRRWAAPTPEEALMAFLQTYTGKLEEKVDERQVAEAGEIPVVAVAEAVEPPKFQPERTPGGQSVDSGVDFDAPF